MAYIPPDPAAATNTIPGELFGVGVAQADYDAVSAKLVAVGEWVDLTAAITTACAGAPAADPDSLAAGLTVTTSTGTFDGATIPCNSFAWTTHTTQNDGYTETLNYDLGTVLSHLAGYDPDIHTIHLEACLITAGTLNSTAPIVALALGPTGALSTGNMSTGWSIATATAATGIYGYATTSVPTSVAASVDPTAVVARMHMRRIPSPTSAVAFQVGGVTAGPLQAVGGNTNTYTTAAKLHLLIGQGSTTSGAISGLKVRFRARLEVAANINLTALDLGCQA